MEKPKVGQKIWDSEDDCQKVWDGSQWQPRSDKLPKYYIEMTEELMKDLEAVVDVAESSDYHDSTNDKSCERVRVLVDKIKKDFERL